MPDRWDANPDNVFSPTDDSSGPAQSNNDDNAQQVRLKDDRGRLRFPAYVLIALVMAMAAITASIVAVLVGFN